MNSPFQQPKRIELMSKLAFSPRMTNDKAFSNYVDKLKTLNELLRSSEDDYQVVKALRETNASYLEAAAVTRSDEISPAQQERFDELGRLYSGALERWTQVSRLKDAVDELYIPLSDARQNLPHTSEGNKNAVKLHSAMQLADRLTRFSRPPLELVEQLVDSVNDVIRAASITSEKLTEAVNQVEEELVHETIDKAVS